jgi:tetratricopeptide (TPR) repeat protein
MQYERDPPPLTQIGSELGVGFVGECSVQKEADRIRVIFQLIDAVSDEHLWAEEYDRDLTTQHLLEINSDIASRVAGSLQTVILPEERTRIDRLPTPSITAHDAYFLARHYLEDLTSVSEAVRFFELAIEEDPTFALAHSGLAMAYDYRSSTGGIYPREGWVLAEQSAHTALELDSALAEAYAVLGDARMIRWEWPGAEEAFQRAIELRPSYAIAHQWYSILLIAQGRIEEALTEAQVAVEVNPRVGGSLGGQAIRMFQARRYDEALSLFEEALSLTGGGGLVEWWASWAFAFSGEMERSFELAGGALELGGDSVPGQGLTAGVHALAGNGDAAREILQDLEALYDERSPEGDYVDPAAFWPAYVVLGELDSAFAWLEQGVEAGSWATLYLGIGPWADPLRDDPRYQALLDRIGLGHLGSRFDSLAAAAPGGGR